MQTNLAQTGARRACFCCGSLDHLLPDCPYKTTRPREQWHRPDKYRDFNALQTGNNNNNQSNEGRSMLQTGSNATQDTTSNGRNNVQWSFVQAGRFLSTSNNDGLSFQHRLNDDDDSSFVNIDEEKSNTKDFESLLKMNSSMDSGSTFHLAAGTKNIKKNSIRQLINPFWYGSNVGSRDITHEGESKIFEGSMEKIDYDAKASVRSLSQMVQEGWTILMDTRLANGFIVEKDGIVRRFMEYNGLYMLVPEDEDLNEA